jgi:iron complex outermembrane receptor protein
VLFVTTVLSLGLGSSALAQDKAPAPAQDNGYLSEIIVTARRVEERLQDVPISITVFNQAQLNDRAIVDASDLATYTPSLQASSNFGPNNASFAIRGFVQDNFTAPSVGVYLADVISPRGAASVQSGDGAGPGSFFDLQNVQVLKGPQGTLFGRNTTGGAILLVPQKPRSEFGGYLEASVGNFGLRKYQGVLNVPLGDRARLRVGVDSMQRDGYLDNIGAYGPRHLADTDYTAGRASLVVDVTSKIENYSILTYAHSDTAGFTQRPTECNPAATISSSGQVLPTGRYACAQVARLDASGNFYAVENAVSNPRNEIKQWQFINTTTWELSDNLTVKNIASYAELKNYNRSSVFGNYWIIDQNAPGPGNTVRPGFLGQVITPAQATNAPDHPLNDQSTLTEELQFQGKALDGRLTWQAGGYYEHSGPIGGFVGTMGQNNGLCGQIGFNPATNSPDASSCALPYSLLSGLSRDLRSTKFTDKAVYAQGTYDLTDRLSVTAGLRYTQDQSSSVSQNYAYTYNGGVQLPAAFGGIRCTNVGATVAKNCTTTAEQRSHATTGLIDLAYRPADNIMIYGQYSRGYRQGIVNPRGVPPYDKIGQEKVDTYETGFKTSWNGSMPGYLNFAAFYNDFSNQQLLIAFLDARGGTNASACACGTSKIYGVELDGSASLFEGFKLTGSLGYLHTELEDFTAPTLPVGYVSVVPGNATGFPLNQSPKWKGSMTASYRLPLSEGIGKVTAAATYAYTDDYYAKSTQRAHISSFDTLNLNLNWEDVGGKPVDLSLFATNVTNEKYYTFATDLYDGVLGFVSKVQGQPRMFGARLRYRFGGDAS